MDYQFNRIASLGVVSAKTCFGMGLILGQLHGNGLGDGYNWKIRGRFSQVKAANCTVWSDSIHAFLSLGYLAPWKPEYKSQMLRSFVVACWYRARGSGRGLEKFIKGKACRKVGRKMCLSECFWCRTAYYGWMKATWLLVVSRVLSAKIWSAPCSRRDTRQDMSQTHTNFQGAFNLPRLF